MPLWERPVLSDGTVHHQVAGHRLRRYAGGAVREGAASVADDLARDPATGALWVSRIRNAVTPRGVIVTDPATLETVREVDAKLWRFAALPDGRMAAILGEEGGAVARLVTGPLGGPWDVEEKLDFDDARACGPGICGRAGVPHVRWSPGLSLTRAGLSVWDGKTGLVAVRRVVDGELEAGWSEVLQFEAADETDFRAEVMADGVLVTAWWTGRDTRVWYVPRDGECRVLFDGFSAWAMPWDDASVLVADGSEFLLLDIATGEARARAPMRRQVLGGTMAPGLAVFSSHDGVYEVRETADGLDVRYLAAVERFDVSGTLARKITRDERRAQDIRRSRRQPAGEGYRYTFPELDRATAEGACDWLRDLGATEVAMAPTPF